MQEQQKIQKFIDYPGLRKLVRAGHEPETIGTVSAPPKIGPATEAEVKAYAAISTPEDMVDTIRSLPGDQILPTRALAKTLGMKKAS
jgi:hypothetical protein